MEYGRREPIKGASGREPTAFTMKSIKELLADELPNSAEAPTLRTPLPKTQLQQPPHMRGRLPVAAQKTSASYAATVKPHLKASSAPKIEAELTAPPMPLPKSAVAMHETVAQPTLAPEPQAVEKPRSFFGRLINS